MDACDPGIDIKDLKTLIKKNTGGDFSLTRSQICDVYSSIQDGKLPLPPLVLSKDSSYLIDRKSPLTRSDFEKLNKIREVYISCQMITPFEAATAAECCLFASFNRMLVFLCCFLVFL